MSGQVVRRWTIPDGPMGSSLAWATAVGAHRSRLRRRAVLVTSALAGVTLLLFVLTLSVGSMFVAPWDVAISALHLRDDRIIDFVVRGIRFPTAATGLTVGMALGVAGIVFQRLLANPLASPDFVGVSSGASLFGVGAIVLVGAAGVGVPMAALVGALVSSVLIYLLAWRRGVSGYRFILVGIGVSQLMFSLTAWMLARADIREARAAMTWLVGSVGQAGRDELAIVTLAVVILVPVALLLERSQRALELGDEMATALGARVEPARLALLGVAIILVASATAAAGPISFVALIAGPVAQRLLGPASGGLLAAACVGATILLAADLVAQQVLPVPLPTGVVTGAIGAPYLVWLLVTTNRAGRGG